MMMHPDVFFPYREFSVFQKRSYVCGLMHCGVFGRLLSPPTVDRLFIRLFSDQVRRAACAQRSEHTRSRRAVRSSVEDSSKRAMASITTPFTAKLAVGSPERDGKALRREGGQIG